MFAPKSVAVIGDMPAVVYLAAYWPGAPEEFFAPLDTTMEEELARYDGVIFFESAAVGGMGIEGGNPVRNETLEQAAALDANCGRTIRVSSWCGTIRRSLRTISFDLAELDTMGLRARRGGVATRGGQEASMTLQMR